MSDRAQGGHRRDVSGGSGALGRDAVLDMAGVCERVFHALWLAVVVFDRRLSIVMRNQPAEMLFDDAQQVDEALREATIEGRYRDWASELREVMERRRQRQFGGVTFRNNQAVDRLLDLVCAPLTDPGSQEVVGAMLVAEDVTARMSMERRLAVSERLAAVGKHSAKVAHELNNPLDGILRYINLAMRVAKQSGQEKIVDYLERSRGGLMRVVEITGELLEFSRSTYANLEESSINEIVDEAVKAMEDKAVAQGVTTVCDYHEQMPRLRGSGNVFQVFCNLIKNAIDAMAAGEGKLLISTRVAGRDAVIVFEDTGVGLPEEIDRVFEPFFSTKGPGKGTGLGLAICRDILEKYNGRITAERRGGGGSIFTVRIPLESCSQEASR
ncbi:MAG TPA: ATP-binding protein [Phycisphaerae bacterium]|nr:ATP-binding protein [Phycisphaerae bacterium]